MPVIKKKNILGLGTDKSRRIWNEIRDEPYLHTRVTAGDVFGGVVGLFIRFSVSARGIAVFLFGDDPGPNV